MAVSIANLRVTQPVAPGATGGALVDLSAATATADVYVYRVTTLADPAGGTALAVLDVPMPALNFALPALPPHLYNVVVSEPNPSMESAVLQFEVRAYTAPPVPGCTDPAANNYNPNATQDDGSCAYTPPVRRAFFAVPGAQSLRFVRPGRSAGPSFDNVLLADETPLGVTNPGYGQLVERGDTLVLQFQTNYADAPAVALRPYPDSLPGGPAVLTVAAVRVVSGAGQTTAFDAFLRPEPANAAQLRVYFNANTLPLPFQPGNRITLASAGGLNGTYPVYAVLEDPAAAVPYLVLPKAYPTAAQRIDCTVASAYTVQAFDTWQAVLPFASVLAGAYRVRLSVSDAAFGTDAALSEPLEVASTHPDTVLLAYRNFDNAFGLNYSAGLVNRLRVRGRFFQRETATTREVLRESSGRLLLLAAAAYRKVRLDVYLLPDYLHETLAVACCHDFLTVNGLEVVAEEGYAATPVPHYTLSNGTVLLEQADFLGAGNRDDVGDVDGGTLLLANDTFLKVNP